MTMTKEYECGGITFKIVATLGENKYDRPELNIRAEGGGHLVHYIGKINTIPDDIFKIDKFVIDSIDDKMSREKEIIKNYLSRIGYE